MARSLQPYGMDAADEDALLFYCSTLDPPEDWSVKLKWSRMHRFFTEEADWRTNEMESRLTSFYEHGTLSWAMASTVAKKEYETLYPYEPPPPHVEPGHPGSAPWVAWVERDKKRPDQLTWLIGLYDRETQGTTTGRERLLLDHIKSDVARHLEDLVDNFKSRMAWLQRHMEREERRRLEEERRLKLQQQPKVQATPQSKRREHRKYGELPKEPVVLTRRKPSQD